MRRKTLLRRAKALVIGSALAVVVVEASLRLAGFEFQLYPTRMQVGWPDPVSMRSFYDGHERLLWVPKDYDERVARAIEERPDHVFMGCSCTEFGRYDEAFERRLQQDDPDVDYTFVNLGVGGWSSYQGLQQMEQDVVRIRPRMITVYYGWNDHWCTFGVEDRLIGGHQLEHPKLLTWLSQHLRVAQLVNRTLFRAQFDGLPEQNRVSLEDFRGNLERIVELAREHSITPVLLTAPSAHEVGDEPVYLTLRWLRRKEDLVPLHQAYADVVRSVARDMDVHLVDLIEHFERLGREERLASFQEDGVHLNERGNGHIGLQLYRSLRRAGLLELLTR